MFMQMQAPSLALMAIKCANTVAEVTAAYAVVGGDDRLGRLACEGICRFADGCLPGDLGDTPKALSTGGGGEKQLLCDGMVTPACLSYSGINAAK